MQYPEHRKNAAFNDPVLLFIDAKFPAAQVCVPSNWATSEVIQCINKHENLVTQWKFPIGWQWALYTRPELSPDDLLARIDCPYYPGHEHIMLKGVFTEA